MNSANQCLQIAKRCKLIPGLPPVTYDCPCCDWEKDSCPLTQTQRDMYATHSSVIALREKKDESNADHSQET